VLTLTREVGQKILIGDDIVITVVAVSGNGRVKIGIEAPQQVRIDREEVLERIRQENRESASASPDATAWASYGSRRAGSRSPAGEVADPVPTVASRDEQPPPRDD
jgi:carbon storage regulator